MNIGLLFGSFNPVHIGHLIIANHFVEFTDIEEVWFVVSPQNPLKDKKTLLDARMRLKMVEAAISGNDKFKVSDVEFDLPSPSYTINTLQYLKKKHAWYDFHILMGSDSFADITKWKDYKMILEKFPTFIYKRRDAPIKNTGAFEKVSVFEFPFIDISSTYIRELMKDGKSIQYLVPEKSLKILKAVGELA